MFYVSGVSLNKTSQVFFMIDFHCHILPEIDDGPASIDESVAMAGALRDAGFTKVYCTPHLIKGFFDIKDQDVRTAVSKLQARLADEQINIELMAGREYYMDEFLISYLKDPLLMGNSRFVMIEIPDHADSDFVKETLFRIKCSGLAPMISHPERCRLLAAPEEKRFSWGKFFNAGKNVSSGTETKPLLNYLKDIGCAFQANLGSFDGWYGPDAQKAVNNLMHKKIYTHFGTDAHNVRGITRLPAPATPEIKSLLTNPTT
jgi:protein-tyrosine phosphatase